MANQFTSSRFQRPPDNPRKDITAVRIIPYYIDKSNKVMILLAESNDWQDWSSLGGSCKSSENHIKCLARELFEESQLLFNLDPHCSLKSCAKLEYTLITFHSHFKRYFNYHNIVYFVECIDSQATQNIVDHFNDPERQAKFRVKYANNPSLLEMSSLQFIELNGSTFLKYLTNTLSEYSDRIKHHSDLTLKKYTDAQLHNVLKEVKQQQESQSTDHQRFDIKFLAGIIEGITAIYKSSSTQQNLKNLPQLTIADIITGLSKLIQTSNCQYNFSLSS